MPIRPSQSNVTTSAPLNNETVDTAIPAIPTATETVNSVPLEKIVVDGRIVDDFVTYLKTLPINEDKEITYKQLAQTAPKIAIVWGDFADHMGATIDPDTVVYTISVGDTGQYVGNPTIKRKKDDLILAFPKGYAIPLADNVVNTLIVLDRRFVYKPLKLPLAVAVLDGEVWDKSSAFSDPSELIGLIREDLKSIKIDKDTLDFSFDILAVILEGVSKKTGEPYVLTKIALQDGQIFSYFIPVAKEFNKDSLPLNGCTYNKSLQQITIRGKNYSTVPILPFNKLAENSHYTIMRLKPEKSKFNNAMQYQMELKDAKGDKLSAYANGPISANLTIVAGDTEKYNNGGDKIVIFTKKLSVQNNGKISLSAQLDIPVAYDAMSYFGAPGDEALVLPW